VDASFDALYGYFFFSGTMAPARKCWLERFDAGESVDDLRVALRNNVPPRNLRIRIKPGCTELTATDAVTLGSRGRSFDVCGDRLALLDKRSAGVPSIRRDAGASAFQRCSLHSRQPGDHEVV
jgi:hypothetical protein